MTEQNLPVKPLRIGEYLMGKGLLSQQALDAALQEQIVTQERLGMILTRGGFITRAALLEAILATRPEMIHGESFFSAKVPPEVLLATKTMVVAETETQVFLASLASEAQARADIQEYFYGMELLFVAADIEKVDNYLEKVRAMHEDDDALLDRILRRAFTEGVSDVHIGPRYNSYTIMFRHLGVRHWAHEGTLDEYNALAAQIKDKSRMDLAERRIPQDGGFQMEINGKLVDLRVSTAPTGNSEAIVMRLLDPDKVQPTLDGLGITRVAEWRKGVSRQNGLCLICGPTGAGKTSTLNASVKERNRFEEAIFLMEDPVEFRIPYTVAVNKNESVGLDFARGIKSFMRMDPDVIILGEIRDEETARNAVKAGETGHLVMGTLHTNSIPGTVSRLRDIGIPGHELADLLRVIMVQQLIRSVCRHCKGEGCPGCQGSGFGGRTIISECAYFPDAASVKRLLDGEIWWPTLLDDAILKCTEGVTTRDEVIRLFGEPAIEKFELLDRGVA